jgi:hypothetical protein
MQGNLLGAHMMKLLGYVGPFRDGVNLDIR